jgi:hypothetical protein
LTENSLKTRFPVVQSPPIFHIAVIPDDMETPHQPAKQTTQNGRCDRLLLQVLAAAPRQDRRIASAPAGRNWQLNDDPAVPGQTIFFMALEVVFDE